MDKEQWIRVDEKMPELIEHVWVWISSEQFGIEAWLIKYEERFIWDSQYSEINNNPPEFWQPLPKEPFANLFFDKNGKELPFDCIVYGHLLGQTELHYFRTGFQHNKMFACTWGYEVMTQQLLNNFEWIGSFEENEHLLECD